MTTEIQLNNENTFETTKKNRTILLRNYNGKN